MLGEPLARSRVRLARVALPFTNARGHDTAAMDWSHRSGRSRLRRRLTRSGLESRASMDQLASKGWPLAGKTSGENGNVDMDPVRGWWEATFAHGGSMGTMGPSVFRPVSRPVSGRLFTRFGDDLCCSCIRSLILTEKVGATNQQMLRSISPDMTHQRNRSDAPDICLAVAPFKNINHGMPWSVDLIRIRYSMGRA